MHPQHCRVMLVAVLSLCLLCTNVSAVNTTTTVTSKATATTTAAGVTATATAAPTAAPDGSSSESTGSGSGSRSENVTAQNTTVAPPVNTSAPPPPLPDPVPSASITAMQTTAALVSLLAAPLNPSLCPHASRTTLIIDQSRCNFNAQLNQIEVVFYPIQIGFADSQTGKYFAAVLILWPFALLFLLLHYVLVLKGATGGANPEESAVLHDLSQQRYMFPSLTGACLALFFWQQLVSSGMTVLIRGVSTWPKIIALTAVVFATIFAAFVGRYFALRRALIECVPVDVVYQRRHAFHDFILGGGDVKRMLGLVVVADDDTTAGGGGPDDKADGDGDSPNKSKPPAKEDGGDEMQPRAKDAARMVVVDKSPRRRGDGDAVTAPLDSKAKSRIRALLHRDWYATVERTDEAAATRRRPSMGVAAWRSLTAPLFQRVFLSEQRWCDAAGRYGFAAKNGFMFQHYAGGRQWFMIVELIFCTIFGALDGIKPQSVNGCWILATSNFSFLALYVLLLLVLRPYLTLWDNISFLLITSQQAASCGLLLGAGDQFSEGIRQTGETYGFACLSVVTAKGLVDFGVKMYLKSIKDKAWAVKNGEASDDEQGDSSSDEDANSSDDENRKRKSRKNKRGDDDRREGDSTESDDDERSKRGKSKKVKKAAATPAAVAAMAEPLLRVPAADTRSPEPARRAGGGSAAVSNPLERTVQRGAIKVSAEDAEIDVNF